MMKNKVIIDFGTMRNYKKYLYNSKAILNDENINFFSKNNYIDLELRIEILKYLLHTNTKNAYFALQELEKLEIFIIDNTQGLADQFYQKIFAKNITIQEKIEYLNFLLNTKYYEYALNNFLLHQMPFLHIVKICI